MEYIRRDNKNYMTEEYREAEVDRLCFNMLKKRRLKTLIPVGYRYVDDRIFIEYDITGLQPVSRIFERRKLGRTEIEAIVRCLLAALNELEEYLLTVDNIHMSVDMIFSNISGDMLYFCPVFMRAEHEQPFKALMDFIMARVNYDIQEAVGLTYSLVKASEGESPREDMLNLIKNPLMNDEEKRDSEDEVFLGIPEISFKSRKKKRFLFRREKKKTIPFLAESDRMEMDFDEHEAVEPERSVFVTKPLEGQICAKQYFLRPVNSYDQRDRVEIKHFPYVIGKLEEGIDYRPDSQMVSRLHARFELGDDGITLEDLNSSNGTYINGESIFGKGNVLLKDGDMISFADMGYRLEIYGGR